MSTYEPPESAGWAVDPTRRFTARYFNGYRWTEHVYNPGRPPTTDRLQGDERFLPDPTTTIPPVPELALTDIRVVQWLWSPLQPGDLLPGNLLDAAQRPIGAVARGPRLRPPGPLPAGAELDKFDWFTRRSHLVKNARGVETFFILGRRAPEDTAIRVEDTSGNTVASIDARRASAFGDGFPVYADGQLVGVVGRRLRWIIDGNGLPLVTVRNRFGHGDLGFAIEPDRALSPPVAAAALATAVARCYLPRRPK
jgi:hypothetical protein